MTTRGGKRKSARTSTPKRPVDGIDAEVDRAVRDVIRTMTSDTRAIAAGVRELVSAHRKASALFTNPKTRRALAESLVEFEEDDQSALVDAPTEEELRSFILFEEARLANATPIYITSTASGLVASAGYALPSPYIIDPDADLPYPAFIRVGDTGNGMADDVVFLVSPAVEPKTAERLGIPEITFGIRTSFFNLDPKSVRVRYGSHFGAYAAYEFPADDGCPISKTTAPGHVRTFFTAAERAMSEPESVMDHFSSRNAFLPALLALIRCGALRIVTAPPTPRHVGPEPLLLVPSIPSLPGEDAADYTARVSRNGRWSHHPDSGLPQTRIAMGLADGSVQKPPRYPVSFPCWHIAGSDEERLCRGVPGGFDEPWEIDAPTE